MQSSDNIGTTPSPVSAAGNDRKRSLGLQHPENTFRLNRRSDFDTILETDRMEKRSTGTSCQTSDHLFSSLKKANDRLNVLTESAERISLKGIKTVNFAQHDVVLPFHERFPVTRSFQTGGMDERSPPRVSPNNIMSVEQSASLFREFTPACQKYGGFSRHHETVSPSRSPGSSHGDGRSDDPIGVVTGRAPEWLHRRQHAEFQSTRASRHGSFQRRPNSGNKHKVSGVLREETGSGQEHETSDRSVDDSDQGFGHNTPSFHMKRSPRLERPSSQPPSHSAAHHDEHMQRTEEDRSAIAPPPKYQIGVLEEGWQYRSKEDYAQQPRQHKKQCLPPFKGCSIYKTSYRPPPSTSYERDYALWQNREKAEGQSKLIEGDDKDCRENYTTTTDLVYRIMPQMCPKLRQYNANALEWFPPQNFLSCYGNLTQHGLRESKRAEWTADLRLLNGASDNNATDTTDTHMLQTSYWDHFRQPPQQYLVKDRRALKRMFSSSMDSNNNAMANQTLRGKCSLQVPIVDPNVVQIPECRYPLPILPTLPEDPPYRIGPPMSAPSRRRPTMTGSTMQRRPIQQYPLRVPIEVC